MLYFVSLYNEFHDSSWVGVGGFCRFSEISLNKTCTAILFYFLNPSFPHHFHNETCWRRLFRLRRLKLTLLAATHAKDKIKSKETINPASSKTHTHTQSVIRKRLSAVTPRKRFSAVTTHPKTK
jgi:hypothetical protein